MRLAPRIWPTSAAGQRAVGVVAAAQGGQHRLLEVVAAVEQPQEREGDVDLGVAGFGVAGQRHQAIASVAQAQPFVVGGEGGARQPLDGGPLRQIVDGQLDQAAHVGDEEGQRRHGCQHAFSAHRLFRMIEGAVERGVVRGQVGRAREDVAPDLGADGAAHARLPELIGEAARHRRMDAQAPVTAEDAVLIEGIPAPFQPGRRQVVRGERGALLLEHLEPEDLEVEVVVGWHLRREHRGGVDLDPAFVALEARTNGSPHRLADPAAEDLVEIAIVVQREHRELLLC